MEEGGRAGARANESLLVAAAARWQPVGRSRSTARPHSSERYRKTHLLAAVTALCRTALSGPAPSDRGALGAPGVIVAITPKAVGL